MNSQLLDFSISISYTFRMLSYQHEYHFGNHADIIKHLTLSLILSHLNEKDKPYSIIDAHAGAGRYHIADEKNAMTGEFERGISLLLSHLTHSEHICKTYFEICKCYMAKNFYPGSPEIERCMARAGDKITLMELHPQEIIKLKDNMKLPVLYGEQKREHISIHCRNSYEGVIALMPPEPKRGVLLLDPSYEETSDYENVAKIALEMNKRWNTGIVAIWYPLLVHRKAEIARIKAAAANCVQKGSDRKVLYAEMCVQDENDTAQPRLYGSGMIVINPPWKLQEELSSSLPKIAKTLSNDYGKAEIDVL